MKFLSMTCPNCGSKLSLDKETGECICNSCGGQFLLEAESPTQHIEIDNAEDAGYEFEKGRQKAQAEAPRDHSSSYVNTTATRTNSSSKKSNLKWWVIGWIFFFPIPLTILVYRSKSLPQKAKVIILSVLWGYVAIATLISSCNKALKTDDNVSNVPVSNITGFSYSVGVPTELDLTVGDTYEHGWVRPSYNRRGYVFSADDIVFVSENPEIATMTLTKVSLVDYLYFRVDAISEGETYIYAMSSDGLTSSDRIHIIVRGITEAESLEINSDNETILLGQSVQLNAVVIPEDTVDQSLTWCSSDESIVTVDSEGVVTAVGPGEAVVTATTVNGISDDCNMLVDGAQRIVNLSFSSVREDDNNIGDEWNYVREINGEQVSRGDYAISVGEELSIYVRYSEDDDNPDVGEATVSHIVTENDFNNGFSEVIDLYVTENGGRNSGQSAHYIVTFNFEVQ